VSQLRWTHLAAIFFVFGVLACGGSGENSSDIPPQPPGVINVFPPPNESAASAVAEISATFDTNMNSASADSFTVYGSQTGKLSGIYTGGGTTALSFDPAANFKPGEKIEVTLTQSLTSTGGVGLNQPYVYRFWAEAGAGTGIFFDVQTISGQANAIALAAGDWDGDGDLDLAVANFGANQVRILRNDGTGNYSVSSTITDQVGATGIVAGDWDGDGDLDLAAANFGSNSITILENDGIGMFTLAGTILAQTGPKALTAGDWDGDGDPDLAAANFSSNSISILKTMGREFSRF